MKKLVVVTILLIGWLFSNAQTVAVQCDKMNILYAGIDNPLTIAVEGYSGNDIMVTTDNGIIKGNSGHYVAIPDHKGQCTITVQTKKDRKKLSEIPMRIKCVDLGTAYLLGKNRGILSANLIPNIIAPVAWLDGFDFNPHIIIFHMTVTIIRDSEIVIHRSVSNDRGVRFSDDGDVSAAIQSLKKRDKLIITEIMAKSRSGNDCDGILNTIELTIN